MNKRTRVAEGIYRDRYGYDVRMTVRGVQRTKRFTFDTLIDDMKVWQDLTRAEVRKQTANSTPDAPPTDGTLEAEAPRYLSQIAGRKSIASDRSHMNAWIKRLGTWPTKKITTVEVNESFSDWQLDGVKNQTIIHRRRVLREMWKMLYKGAVSPVVDARRIPKPRPKPVRVPAAIIDTVDKNFKALKLPVEYAIWRVRVTTGQRPCQINSALPIHVSFDERKWTVLPSEKEDDIHVLYLNDDMLHAWKLFFDANAWGKVDTCRQADLLHKCGWPTDIRPYNLRHTVAFVAMANGADLGDVQMLMGHRQIETTRNNYAPGQEDRMRDISKLIDGRFKQQKGNGSHNGRQHDGRRGQERSLSGTQRRVRAGAPVNGQAN